MYVFLCAPPTGFKWEELSWKKAMSRTTHNVVQGKKQPSLPQSGDVREYHKHTSAIISSCLRWEDQKLG